MSSDFANINAGKKAVHVKWAGKTIALGTFPGPEADEKCARAKALTRAWRSTMRPKPTREWVMLELERLGVRIVIGRLGRKADDGEDTLSTGGNPASIQASGTRASIGLDPTDASTAGSLIGPGHAGISHTAARRNSSLGLTVLDDGQHGSLGSFGNIISGDPLDVHIPPHRPYKGGGAAAAYEAAFHDHYLRISEEQQRRATSLGLGSLSGSAVTGIGNSVNPDQHYEMLKLHHMNLLNEIQETTLMMNLFQQQQLRQQQLQQQTNTDIVTPDDSQLSLLLQRQQQNQSGNSKLASLGHLLNNAQLVHQQRESLGLGRSQFGLGGFNAAQQAHLHQPQLMLNNNQGGSGAASGTENSASRNLTEHDGRSDLASDNINSKRRAAADTEQTKRQKIGKDDRTDDAKEYGTKEDGVNDVSANSP